MFNLKNENRYKKNQMRFTRYVTIITLFAALTVAALLSACTSTGGDADVPSLEEAIEQSASDIIAKLPEGTRVVIVAFDSPHRNLSAYIMDELAGALAGGKIEVADRNNLEFVYKELGFQMSGEVNEDSAQSIGKFLGAQYVISGQLVDSGSRYRYRLNGINVETAVHESSTRLDVRNDRSFKELFAALQKSAPVARSSYGEGSASTPKSAGTFLDRGLTFASRGEYDMAIEDFTEAINLDPNLALAYFQRGKAYFARQAKVYTGITADFDYDYIISRREKTSDDDLAIQDFSQAIQLQPDNPILYFWRSQIYIDICEDDKALADCNQAIRLDPNYAMAYRNRGNVYSYKGDSDRAIADYTQAIKIDPNRNIAYNNRGNTYADKGDYDRAMADYTQAIRIDPNAILAYNNRGTSYADKGQYDLAIADYNQAIQINPNYANAYINRGNAYFNKEQYDLAIADYTQAIRIDPNDAYAYTNRGLAYTNKKDYDKAIADCNHAIRIDPNNAYAYNNRGLAYTNKGQYDLAIADYSQVIRIDPNNAYAYGNRGDAYFNKGQLDLAIADYNQAIRIDPNNAYAYGNRGGAYHNKGDYAHARADYEKALQLDPNNSYARNNLENLRKQGH